MKPFHTLNSAEAIDTPLSAHAIGPRAGISSMYDASYTGESGIEMAHGTAQTVSRSSLVTTME